MELLHKARVQISRSLARSQSIQLNKYIMELKRDVNVLRVKNEKSHKDT